MRLSVIVLLDTSASMHGTQLSAMRDGYDIILRMVQDYFRIWTTIGLSVLSYESDVTVHCRHVSLEKAPTLLDVRAMGLSNLGKALRLLREWIQEDASQAAVLVLLMSDGPGTDDWWQACADLQSFQSHFRLIGVHAQNAEHFGEMCLLGYEISISEIHTRMPECLQREEAYLSTAFQRRTHGEGQGTPD